MTDDVHVDKRLVEMQLKIGSDGELEFTEMPQAVVDRMTAAIDDMAAAHRGERVIVVGHGAAIVAYLTYVLQLEPGHLRLLPHYTSVSVVRALGDRRMVGALGDRAHLE